MAAVFYPFGVFMYLSELPKTFTLEVLECFQQVSIRRTHTTMAATQTCVMSERLPKSSMLKLGYRSTNHSLENTTGGTRTPIDEGVLGPNPTWDDVGNLTGSPPWCISWLGAGWLWAGWVSLIVPKLGGCIRIGFRMVLYIIGRPRTPTNVGEIGPADLLGPVGNPIGGFGG